MHSADIRPPIDQPTICRLRTSGTMTAWTNPVWIGAQVMSAAHGQLGAAVTDLRPIRLDTDRVRWLRRAMTTRTCRQTPRRPARRIGRATRVRPTAVPWSTSVADTRGSPPWASAGHRSTGSVRPARPRPRPAWTGCARATRRRRRRKSSGRAHLPHRVVGLACAHALVVGLDGLLPLLANHAVAFASRPLAICHCCRGWRRRSGCARRGACSTLHASGATARLA